VFTQNFSVKDKEIVVAASFRGSSGNILMTVISLIYLLNFCLSLGLKVLWERNFIFYISNLEHRLFSIAAPTSTGCHDYFRLAWCCIQ